MKKKPVEALFLFDARGEELFCAPAIELKLKPEIINRLSDEFFGDPEPCYIHQSAVICRAVGEIELSLRGRGRVKLKSLPDALARYFSAYPDCSECELRPFQAAR